MGKKKNNIEVFIGSGNVFEDLGFQKAEEAQAKADLARQIYHVIQGKKLTQKQAGELMGIDQPKVSDIIRGKLSKFSIERLMRFLLLLGLDIEIRVKVSSKKSHHSTLFVTTDCNARKRPRV